MFAGRCVVFCCWRSTIFWGTLAPLERNVKTKQQAWEKTMIVPGGWYMFLYLQAMLSSYKSISALRLHKHPDKVVVSRIINFSFESLGEILQCDLGLTIPRPKARRKCGDWGHPIAKTSWCGSHLPLGQSLTCFRRGFKKEICFGLGGGYF